MGGRLEASINCFSFSISLQYALHHNITKLIGGSNFHSGFQILNRTLRPTRGGGGAYLVECLQVVDGRGLCGKVGEFVLQVCDQHPKLCPPVSYVVQPGQRGETGVSA